VTRTAEATESPRPLDGAAESAPQRVKSSGGPEAAAVRGEEELLLPRFALFVTFPA